MKIFLNIARLIVGLLFIFSGLVKANDPLGLSYKMQEFFEVWGWDALNHFTLAFSVIMIVFEIVAGVAVLLGWKMNLFSWLLLLLIVFFTFLTGYALFSGKIRECGCFGDCIPLQAYQSFIKDLILLVLILVIFPFRDKITTLVKPATALGILLFSAIFSFALQRQVLIHLPVVDCLPYKVGNNLANKMKAPPGSIPDSTVILFTYSKNGKESSFTADHFPEDFGDAYTFVRREDKVVRKGTSTAAIRDFALQTGSGNDTTMAVLQDSGYAYFLFLKDEYVPGKWVTDLRRALVKDGRPAVRTFLVSNLEFAQLEPLLKEFPGMIPLRADGTAIKTAARHNPTLLELKDGTVMYKVSAPDFDEIRFANQ